jgi:hypothetical protein
MKYYKIVLMFTASSLLIACSNKNISTSTVDSLSTNINESGTDIEIRFFKGIEHNHPTFAFWLEDLEGNYLQSLYVTEYLGTGVFGHASLGDGKWDNKPGISKRPASLPYWLHKRNISADGVTLVPTPEQPVADAITSATPKNDFVLNSRSSNKLEGRVRLLMEINQPWDWNEYWNNTIHTDNNDYKSSCQPALVYAVTINMDESDKEYFLNPIGHSSFDGSDGELYTDLTSITTAKNIVHKVAVRIKK